MRIRHTKELDKYQLKYYKRDRCIESGQMYFDKDKCYIGLYCVYMLNKYYKISYKYSYGDKDTFGLGFNWVNQHYYLNDNQPDIIYHPKLSFQYIGFLQKWKNKPMFIHLAGMERIPNYKTY